MGDIIEIDIERIVWQVEVLGLCDVRGPAPVAQTLYAETDEGRAKPSAARRSASPPPACRADRPSGTGALSTNFQVRTEVVFHRCMNAALLGVAFRDGAGRANGGRFRDEYQRDPAR